MCECSLKGRAKGGILRFSCTAPDLRNEKIHAKWCILVFQKHFQLGNLLTQHVWGVADASDDAETAGIGNSCCELWAGGYIHTSKHDGMVDFEEIGNCGSELLWKESQSWNFWDEGGGNGKGGHTWRGHFG